MKPLLEVNYPAERDAAAWEHRHAAGEVPGRWPYGLDQVTGDAWDLLRRSVPRPSRRRRVTDRLPATPFGRVRVGLGWDENMAVRMGGRSRYRSRLCGAIWVSDALAAGRDDRVTRTRLAALRRMDVVWCLSRAQVPVLAEQLGPDGPPVEFVGFGVDPVFYAAQPYPERGDPVVLSVGGDRDRDAATLFAALELLRRARPDTEIIVQTTSDLPPPSGVRVVRHFTHRQLQEVYARASVVAVATRPNLHVSGMTVALEAMSTARPVVLTATPGMDDYVHDGRTGLLAEPGDAEGIAERVRHLLDQPDLAAGFGAAGRRHVENAASSAVLAGRLRNLVTRVLS